MQYSNRSPEFGPDGARAFIAQATWTFAETYARFAPHEYTTRWACRSKGIEPGFEAFCELIRTAGYWRDWGRRRWRSLDLDDHFFWLHWNPVTSVKERTVVNRWLIEARTATGQLTLEVD